MKKIRIFCLLLAVLLFATALYGCTEEEPIEPIDTNLPLIKEDDVASGTKVTLSEEFLICDQSFRHHTADSGFVDSVQCSLTVDGYDASYSYYDVVVTATWSFLYLNENGDYVQGTKSLRVELNARGEGSGSDAIPSEIIVQWRNIKDVTCSYSFEGFAVKK